MTPLYHARKSDGRWFVRAFALLIIAFPAVAQQANVSAPLSADEVIGRVRNIGTDRERLPARLNNIANRTVQAACPWAMSPTFAPRSP